MAHTTFTGKEVGTIATINAITLTGWKEITIEENGRPIPEAMDKTAAGDSTWTTKDDALGGQGSPSSKITFAGLLSRSDKFDNAGGLTSLAKNVVVPVVVTTATGTGKDKFTMTGAEYMGLVTPHTLGDLTPYTATFELSTSAGVWSSTP